MRRRTVSRETGHPQAGVALLVVLIVLMGLAGTSASFVWFMNQQQTRAGTRYRSVAALALADAGIQRALETLEMVPPDRKTHGREWRPSTYTEELVVGTIVGRLTLSLADAPDGTILISSTGEFAGEIRRVRARVYLASPALLAALYGTSFIWFEGLPVRIFIVPAGPGIGEHPWIHIAAGQGIWFANAGALVNDPSVMFQVNPGPVESPSADGSAARHRRDGNVRLLLARGADLRTGENRDPLDAEQLLRGQVKATALRADTLSPLPVVDRSHYKAEARANTANAVLNQAAGRFLGQTSLVEKRDSLYSLEEWTQIQTYLRAGWQEPRFAGVLYVMGGVSLLERERLQIANGALITEGSLHLGSEASLEVTHTAGTRRLPGLLILDQGALIVAPGARLLAHGLVYADRVFGVGEGARVDIVGAVLGGDRDLSFRNQAGTVVIRYDPAVLGTQGLRVPSDSPVVAWIASWEELQGPAPAHPPVQLVARPETTPRSDLATPAPPPASPVSPSRTAPPPAARVAPNPRPPGMAPSPRTPPVVLPRPEQSRVDQAAAPAVGPSPGESPTLTRPSLRARTAKAPREQGLFKVQVGAFSVRENAEERTTALRQEGFTPRIVLNRGLYKVRVGTYRDRARAEELANQLRARGYAVIVLQ